MTDPLIQRELDKAKAFIATQETWARTHWLPLVIGFVVGALVGWWL